MKEPNNKLDLEDRLGSHLRTASEQHVSTSNIETVRRTAKRRTIRSRAVVGACGLLALVGAASLIPNNNDSSALITAADPTPVEVPETETPVETPSERPTPPLVTVDPPPPHRIIGDGNGGFAAIAVTTSTGRTKFVRSEDGENWVDGGELQIEPGRFLSNLRHIGGSFVATIDESGQDTAGDGLMSPQIAISSNLLDWQVYDFDFGDDEPNRRYDIADIAIAANRIGVTIFDRQNIDYAAQYGISRRDQCGYSQTAEGSFLTMCSGEQVELKPEHSSRDGVTTKQRYFLSTNGGTLREQRDGPSQQQFSDIYGVAGNIETIERGLLSERTRALWADDLKGDEPIEVLRIMSNADRDETVTLLEQDSRVIAVWQRQGEYEVAYLPESVQLNIETGLVPHLAQGPAGWAALVNSGGSLVRTLEVDGWLVRGFFESPAVSLTSSDGSEFYDYWSSDGKPSPYAQVSLFGAIRLSRPGTEVTLIEIPGDQARAAAQVVGAPLALPPSAEFDQELVVDGWTLRGDPLRGPLTLTDPEGSETIYDDGFAFTNDETSDGVEVHAAVESWTSPFALMRRGSYIEFFATDGETVVAFPTAAVFESLVLPVVGVPDDDGGFDLPSVDPSDGSSKSWLMHSDDGKTWRILREFDQTWVTSGAALAVGEDEMLLLEPSGVVRIELDE